ncbi:MAG: InlB B-repeat-containing protein [Lachnospiraceae bacterium]|nr:InlB B-repeat-containing protein [Lachnospiraceae bacterium]
MRKIKRTLSLLLCTCMFTTSVPVQGLADATIAAETSTSSYGDADVDKDVDMQDVLLMEMHIKGEKAEINEANADVNADGTVDETDVELVKEYLVGNISTLTPKMCTITFDTKGGEAIEPIKVGKGYSIKKDIPSAVKRDAIFTGWKKSDGSVFYKGDKVTEDITLVATYQDMEKKESVLHIDSYSITDQEPDICFNVIGDYTSIDEVKANITLIPKDGKDPVEVKVEKNSDGSFSIGAVDGFTPGGAYALTLNQGLNFINKEENIRTVNFTIFKEEKDDIFYSDNLIFIRDTEEMTYSIEGSSDVLDVLETALVNAGETDDSTVRGTFNMSDTLLDVNDVVCIYENVDPRDRDYTQNSYEDDSVAYVKITGANNNTYTFENISSDDVDEVLLMPDSIPFRVDVLPSGKTGTVNKDDYDAETRNVLGITEAPEYKNGDFIIFYNTEFEDMDENTEAVYARVTGTAGNIVSYEVVTREYIEEFMGMYVKQSMDMDKLLEEIDEEDLLESIEKNAEESGFVEAAVPQLFQSAMASDKVLASLKSIGATDKEIANLASGESSGGAVEYVVERKNVNAELVKGSRFKNGIKVKLYVDIVLSMNRKGEDGYINSAKLEFYTGFEEEIGVDINVDFEDRWEWYLFIPVLKDLDCDIAIDINNFTAISLNAQCFTIKSEEEEGLWELYEEAAESGETLEKLKEIAKLEAESESSANLGNEQETEELRKKEEKIKNELPELTSQDKTYSFEEIWDRLDRTNVSIIYSNGKSASSREAKLVVDELMKKYSGMINSETIWYDLVNVQIFDKTFNIKVVSIRLSGDFVVKANVNLSICADAEYKVGKRYSFWFKLLDRRSGRNETDLVDETFGFKFHVMGVIQLYATVEMSVDIGIISTSIASIGASVKFGPYMKLYGYFYYIFTNRRIANSDKWYSDEECLGAMYFEFGLYVRAKFDAQLLDGTLEYEKTFYEDEIPIITLGEKSEPYRFATSIDENAILYIRDEDDNSNNGITMKIPNIYRNMQTINLLTGENTPRLHNTDNFNITVTNRKFSVDKKGVITVKPSKNDRYLEGELTITWIHSKYAFSKYDIRITIPVVWTNMTEEEINEKFTASVAVGNKTDGYNVVWSKQYSRTDKFDLPTKAEILELIDYDSYTVNGVNLKYSDVAGYKVISTGLSLASDRVYYFDVTPREYTVTVNDIQNVDGSISTKTYTAGYGEEINFSELESTGTNNLANSTYTRFYNLTSISDDSLVMDMKQIVNREYFNKYGSDIQVKANYVDNSLTATYSFVGIDAPDVEVKFQSGSIPYFEGINEYIEQYGGEGTIIKSISPAVEKINHTVKYTVICEAAIPAPKYDFVFDTQGGSNINSQKYTEGSVIFRPSDPTRRGYEFGGWYSDAGCQNVFSFDSMMPANNVTIYAKWIANTYEVTFVSNNAELDTKTVTYDVTYGELPVPAKQADFRFEGWYTQRNGGNLVTADTIFNELSDITLYAKWVEKDTIPTLSIVTTTQTTTYNEKPQAFNVKLTGNYTNVDGFVVQYKKQGTNTWTSAAQNAGTYDVKITRATDDYYKKFDECVVNGAFVIKKASLSLGTVNAYRLGHNIVVSVPEGAKGDGTVTYYYNSEYIEIGLFSFDPKSLNNTTGVFTDTYTPYIKSAKCYVKIAEGTNYLGATSTTVNVQNLGNYASGTADVIFDITVGNSVGDGTNYPVYGKVIYVNGNYGSQVHLNNSGNDFKIGTTSSFTVDTVAEPWQIAGYVLSTDSALTSWLMTKMQVKVVGSSTWYSTDDTDKQFDGKTSYERSIDLKRRITATGNFNTAGANTVDLSSSSDYSFNYNGLITDQFYSNYNPFTKYSSPTFSVTSGNVTYDKFIRYTGVTSFDIDVEGLRNYIKVNGGSNFNYTVTLSFPTATTTGTTTFTKTITVNTANISSNGSSTSHSTGVTYNNIAIDEVVAENTAKADEYIEVPVKLTKKNNIWGALVNVTYNDEALELAGFESKGSYTTDEFTVQNNPTGKGFKFIVANDELRNVTLDNEFIVLKFKAKDDTKAGTYKVQAKAVQAVSIDGKVKNIKLTGGVVNVSEQSKGNDGTADNKPNDDNKLNVDNHPNVDNTSDDEETNVELPQDNWIDIYDDTEVIQTDVDSKEDSEDEVNNLTDSDDADTDDKDVIGNDTGEEDKGTDDGESNVKESNDNKSDNDIMVYVIIALSILGVAIFGVVIFFILSRKKNNK